MFSNICYCQPTVPKCLRPRCCEGVQLAKEFKARITGICVAPQKAKDAT